MKGRWRNRSDRSVHPWEDLAPVEYFADLSPDNVRAAARGADWCDVPPGTRLERQGMHPRFVWVVTAGVLEVRRDGDVVGMVLPGAAHGEAEVLLGRPAAYDLVAATPATVLSLPAQVFHGLLAEPTFARSVARRMARATLAAPLPTASPVGVPSAG